MFTTKYTQNEGGRAVAMAMLLPPPTKPITLPWQRGFSGGDKKKEEYANPRTEGREVSYGKIGLTTVAVTQDLPSRMPLVLKIELIRLIQTHIAWILENITFSIFNRKFIKFLNLNMTTPWTVTFFGLFWLHMTIIIIDFHRKSMIKKNAHNNVLYKTQYQTQIAMFWPKCLNKTRTVVVKGFYLI